MKPQTIRLLDVFLIGPMMIRTGWLLRDRPIGSFTALIGLMTIIYNLQNYLDKGRSQNA